MNLANLDEDRGVSFAIGGDPGAVTLATLMKNYQPNLHGASLGEHLVEASIPIGCPNRASLIDTICSYVQVICVLLSNVSYPRSRYMLVLFANSLINVR